MGWGELQGSSRYPGHEADGRGPAEELFSPDGISKRADILAVAWLAARSFNSVDSCQATAATTGGEGGRGGGATHGDDDLHEGGCSDLVHT